MNAKIDRLQLITTFLAVAEHGNLTSAARVLGTSQPTVSRRLRDLEELLSVRLAARTTHRFHLTPEGVELQNKATAWADVWSEWEHGLKFTTVVPRGKLTVVGPHGYGNSFLMDAITRFRQAHAHVDVELRLTDGQVDLISQGADCWICAGGCKDQTLHVRRLGTMRRILIAAGDYAARPIKQPRDLEQHPLVGLIPHVHERLVLRSVKSGERVVVRMDSPVATDGLLSSFRAIQQGLGVGSAALWLCGEDLKTGRLQRVLPDWELEPVPIEVVCLAGRFRPARIDAFIANVTHVLNRTEGFEPQLEI